MTEQTTPESRSGILEAVPSELRQRHSFVVWKLEERNNELTKVPYAVKTGYKADTTDSRTWASFSEALEALEGGRYDGLGYVFSSGDPYAGLDLDSCRDPHDGSIEPWAKKIADALDGYTEVSPSQCGLHIIVKGKAPNKKRGPVEAYSTEKFFTLSGDVLEGSRKTIPDRRDRLNALVARVFAEPKAEPNGNGHAAHLTDEEIIELCRKARNAAKFVSLFDEGDTSAHDHDDSRADLALVSLLAFYTQDAEQLDRLFRQSALMRQKWNRPDYRQRTIGHALGALSETYTPSKAGENGHGGASSPSSPYSNYDDDDGSDGPARLSLTSFADVARPVDERPVIIEGAIPERFPSILYGDGGTAKSLLAASMLLDVSRGAEFWMGRKIKKHGPVVYLDFELDLEEQARRVYQLAEGAGLEKPPAEFYYLSGADHPVGPFLKESLRLAKEAGAVMVLLDSLGFALEGDAEVSSDVLRFVRKYIKPFEAAGIALVIVDHQSKLNPGESYHQKSPFGSVYKSNACRSVIQVGVEDQHEGELIVRLRHTKANFGSKFDPFNIRLLFHKTKLETQHRVLSSKDLASEGSLNTPQKIRRLLREGPMFPDDLAEEIDVSVGAVKNSLTALRKAGEVEDTGVTSESGARQVRLVNPPSSSSSAHRDDDGDDGNDSEAASGLWEGAL